MLYERSDFYACSSANQVFVFGGKSPNGQIYHCEKYDPETNSWSKIADLPQAMYNFAGMVTECGKILLSGGFNKNRQNANYRSFLAYCPLKVTQSFKISFRILNNLKKLHSIKAVSYTHLTLPTKA